MTKQKVEMQAPSRRRASGSHENRKSTKAQRIGDLVRPRLLPLKKTAEYLGLTVWAMRERVWSGDIPYIRFPGGRKIYIDIHDLDDFIEKNKMVFN
jgi:hypothetical protein